MANRKISALSSLTAPVANDLLLVVDQSEAADADKNKKITYEDLLTNAPVGSATAPSFAFTTDSDTGLFQTSNGHIGFAVDGGEIGAVTTAGLKLGTGTATAQLHLFSSSLTDEQLIVENTETGATEGPNIVLFRNSSTPADNDVLGSVVYRGENSVGGPEDYAEIRASIIDQTNTEEDGKLEFQTISGGTVGTRMVVASSNVGINETSPDKLLHVTNTAAGTAVKIECTEVSAASGADLLFKNTRNSGAGVAGDDISTITFQSKNAASEDISYASIFTEIVDATDGSEDGRLTFKVKSAGGNVDLLKLDSTLATFGKPVAINAGTAPTAVTSAGTAGELRWDTSYLYICLSTGTDSTSRWRRIAHSAF